MRATLGLRLRQGRGSVSVSRVAAVWQPALHNGVGRCSVLMYADLPRPAVVTAQALYEACPGWGWSDAKKRAELADPAARYLVVFEQQQQQQQQAGGEAAGALAAGGAAAAAGAAPAAAPALAPLTLGAGAAALEAPAAECTAEDQRENLAAAGNNPGSSGSTQAAAGSSGDGCLPGRPVAFLHFRFEVEEGEAVLYCYEIQVAAVAQVRAGRGSR